MDLIENIKEILKENNNKLSLEYVESVASLADVEYFQLSPNMRVCLLRLPTGHEVLGVAQVLDAANDVEEIGKAVAYKNAFEQLWPLLGNIAKAVM